MRIANELSANKTLNYTSSYWELLMYMFDSNEIIKYKTSKGLFHPSQLRDSNLFIIFDGSKKKRTSHLKIAKSKKFVVFELKRDLVANHIKSEIKEFIGDFKKRAKPFCDDFTLLSSDTKNNAQLVKFFKNFISEPMTPRKKQEMLDALDRIYLGNEITNESDGKKVTVCQDDLERMKIALKADELTISNAYLVVGPYQVANLCLMTKNEFAISITGLEVNSDSCFSVANNRVGITNYSINLLTKLFEFIDLNKLFGLEAVFSTLGRHLTNNPNKNSVSRNIFTKFDISDLEKEKCKNDQRFVGVVKTIFNYYGIYLSYNKILSIGEIIKITKPFYCENDISTLCYREKNKEDIVKNQSDATVENLFINDNNVYLGTIEDIGVLNNCKNLMDDKQLEKHINDHSYRFNSEFNYDVSVSSSIYLSMSVEAYKLFKMELDLLMKITCFIGRIPGLHRLSTLHSNVVNIYGCDSLYIKKERAVIFNAICGSSLCLNLRKNIKNLSEGSWREINTLNSRVFPVIQILISLLAVFATVYVCSVEIWNGLDENYSFSKPYLFAFIGIVAFFVLWNVINRFAFNPNNYSFKIRRKLK